MSDFSADIAGGDRLAKVIARSGLCSRRDAEGWIKDGRVTVNGKTVLTPAFNVSEKDKIKVDGAPLAERQGTRVWLYHKPAGLVVTEKDPEGRPTIFEALGDKDLPRVVSIGRLDINTEGLLLLTNDGGLKRVLELPATGWLRRYRVRAFGSVTQPQLDALKEGIEIEGIQYGPIDAQLERVQGSNAWIVLALREGKNREVKNVLGALGLQVNRLIRVSFGPFQLGDLDVGEVETVPARVLRDQLGRRLAEQAGADFESDMPEVAAQAQKKRALNPRLRAAAPGKEDALREHPRAVKRFRFEDDETAAEQEAMKAERPRKDRPGRGTPPPRAARPARPEPQADLRTVFYEDGTEGEIAVKPKRERSENRWDPEDSSARNFGRPAHHELKSDRPRPPRSEDGDRPARKFGDRPQGGKPFGDKKFGDKTFGDRKPYGSKPYGDKPRGDRPDGDRKFGDKKFGDRKPEGRSFGDRPAGGKPFGSKPYGAKPFGGRPDGDRKPYGSRPDGDRKSYGARPEGGDKPFRPRRDEDGAGARPPRPGYGKGGARDGGDRPGRNFDDKPKFRSGPRPEGRDDRRPGGDKSFGGKPYGGKPGGKPFGARSAESKPSGGRGFGAKSGPGGAGKPGFGGPRGGKPGGGRPGGGRPAGGKPRRD